MQKRNLNEYRVLAGYTQKELAEKTKLSLSTIKKLEANSICSIKTARKIILVLNDGLQSMRINERVNIYNINWNVEGLPSGYIAKSKSLKEDKNKTEKNKK